MIPSSIINKLIKESVKHVFSKKFLFFDLMKEIRITFCDFKLLFEIVDRLECIQSLHRIGQLFRKRTCSIWHLRHISSFLNFLKLSSDILRLRSPFLMLSHIEFGVMRLDLQVAQFKLPFESRKVLIYQPFVRQIVYF